MGTDPGTTIPVVATPVDPTLPPATGDVPELPKPAQTATPTTIGMLSAGADAQALVATTIGTDALSSASESSYSTAAKHLAAADPAVGDVRPSTPEHLKDYASAPVGLSAAGSTHNTSAAAGASGSVTCGGASASVLGLLESIFGLGADRSGDMGPLANVRDHAWRLPRHPGFAPD